MSSLGACATSTIARLATSTYIVADPVACPSCLVGHADPTAPAAAGHLCTATPEVEVVVQGEVVVEVVLEGCLCCCWGQYCYC